MPSHMMKSSIASALLLAQAGLERGELGVDLVARAQLADLVLQALRPGAQPHRLGPALGLVDAALEHVEAAERVLRLGARPHLAQAIAVVGAFEPRLDVGLLGARLAQLALQ